MNLFSSHRPPLYLSLLFVFFHHSFTQDVQTCLNCLTSQRDVGEITGDVKRQSFTIYTHVEPESTPEHDGFIPAGNTAGNSGNIPVENNAGNAGFIPVENNAGNADFIPVENNAGNAGFITEGNTADKIEGQGQGGSKNTLDKVGFIPMEGQLCPEGHHLVNGECSLIFLSR